LVTYWKGKIPEGVLIEEPAIAYDWFPTFVRLTGAEMPTDRDYDGQDIWPLLSGATTFKREKPFYWIYLDRVTAVRSENWKLHLGDKDKQLPQPELVILPETHQTPANS